MTHTFRTLRPASLAIMLGLMAFSANLAQAEPGAHWNVEGAAISAALLPEINAKIVGSVTTLLTTSGKTTVEILCTTYSFKGAKLHELGRFTGKIHKSGCKTSLNHGAHIKSCEPKSTGASLGLIETNALEGLIKLHTGGVELLELLPVNAAMVFVTIHLGPLCAIGDLFDIKGSYFLKDAKGEFSVEKKEHEFAEGPLSALLFGSNAMTLDGKFLAFLEGTHVSMNFSGHAN